MDVLNRTIVILVPKTPYLDWANSFEDGGPTIDPEDAREFATTFLIPEIESPDEVAEIVKFHSEYMFECALAGWMEDDSVWPTSRGYTALREWFDIEVYEVPIDLADDPLILEEF